MALVPCQVLHAAILLSYCSILCNYKAIDMPAHQTYGGSWKFLTFIDLCHEVTWKAGTATCCGPAVNGASPTRRQRSRVV
ncbi:androgen-induced gene 1 protein isoform X2 [Heliangelus exortis]|uniref:androgen-induced gene 1 protein isoform X2 n=1 Tax=Heliangelus exortis TaxID=472823 RepID=UPI003A9086AD